MAEGVVSVMALGWAVVSNQSLGLDLQFYCMEQLLISVIYQANPKSASDR